MTVNRYRITLRHDRGKVRITTTGSSAEQATASILAFEHAPPSAVVKVEDLGPV